MSANRQLDPGVVLATSIKPLKYEKGKLVHEKLKITPAKEMAGASLGRDSQGSRKRTLQKYQDVTPL